MKKVVFAFAVLVTVGLAACGSNNTTAINVADSTAVDSAKVDTANVVVDSAKVDSAK